MLKIIVYKWQVTYKKMSLENDPEYQEWKQKRLLEVPIECENMTSILEQCIIDPETFLQSKKKMDEQAEATLVPDWLRVLKDNDVRDQLVQNLTLIHWITQLCDASVRNKTKMISPVVGRPWSYAKSNLDFALPFENQYDHQRSLLKNMETRKAWTIEHLMKVNLLLKDVVLKLDKSAILQPTATNPFSIDPASNPLSYNPPSVSVDDSSKNDYLV